MLSSSDILECDDSNYDVISVPEWGGDVRIRTMTGGERDSWELYVTNEVKKTNSVNVRARLVALTACDKDGKRIFGDGQIAALNKRNGKALDRVYDAALRLNKLTESDIEELEGNL